MKLLLILFCVLNLVHYSSGDSVGTNDGPVSNEGLPNCAQRISSTTQLIFRRLGAPQNNSDSSVYSGSEHSHPPPSSLAHSVPPLPRQPLLSTSSRNSGGLSDRVREIEGIIDDSVQLLLSSFPSTTVTSPALQLPDTWESHDFNWWNFLRFLVMLHLFHLLFPTLAERCPSIPSESSELFSLLFHWLFPTLSKRCRSSSSESSEPLSILLHLFFPTHPKRSPTIPSESSEPLSVGAFPFNPLRCSSLGSVRTENVTVTNEGLPNYTRGISSNSQQILSRQLISSDGSVHSQPDHLHPAPSVASSRSSNLENGKKKPLQTKGNFHRSGSQTEPSCKIPKLHEVLCSEQKRTFCHKRIGMILGPYLQCPDNAKEAKYECLNHILQQPGYPEEDRIKYRQELSANIQMLRACYTSELAMENTFLRTLFLDGSYIYCILRLRFKQETQKTLNYKLLAHDLLHLENQIPFEVVEIINFIFKRCEDKASAADELGLETALSFKSYLQEFIDEKAYNRSNVPKKFCHLLHLAQLLLEPSVLPVHNKEERNLVKEVHSAKYYYDQGVTLKVKKLQEGSARSILDVSFSWGGVLHIPKLIICPENLCILRNLVAFEETGRNGNHHVTEYVEFLSLLIREEEDVKLLSSKEIIFIRSGHTYTDVVNMIKDLGKLVPYLNEESYLAPIYQSLREYSNNETWSCCSLVRSAWNRSGLFWRKVENQPWFIFTIISGAIWGLLSYTKK